MFDDLKARLKAMQDFGVRLDDAAIAMATELRNNVKKRKRAAGKRRKELKVNLRLQGFSAREARMRANKGRRRTSGISIMGIALSDGVKIRASDQVQHFRRTQGETDDLMDIFARNMSVAEQWRKARGL